MAVNEIIAGSAVIKLALAMDDFNENLKKVKNSIDTAAESWTESFKKMGKSIKPGAFAM
jgi:uncharacterized protein YpuA (DUF1002 family)